MTPTQGAVLLALVLSAAACNDDRGLPDLDEPLPRQVGAQVLVTPEGCSPTDVTLTAGQTVELEATADGVSASAGAQGSGDGDRWITGHMRKGETVDWLLSEPGRHELRCGIADRGSTGTLDATRAG